MTPYAILGLSTTTYTTLLTLSQRLRLLSSDPDTNLKALSSLHATVTTSWALYALSQPWPVDAPLPPLNLGLGQSNLDDSTNPVIAGRSALGAAATAWEAGYLLFDTVALAYHLRGRALKREPLILFHHATLFAALTTLQHFVAARRERGVYVVVTLLLMNASTPVLNLRWLLRKRNGGRGSLALDVALAAIFTACRIGSVVWVLREYGKRHGGSGPWEALREQRWVCQAGTGALVGVNALWAGALIKGIVRRMVRQIRQ